MVCNLYNFFELMRNHNAGYTVLFKLYNQIQKICAVIFVKRRCRFVKDKNTYILAQSLCNFDKLLFTGSHILYAHSRITVKPDFFKLLFCMENRFVPVDYSVLVLNFMSHINIFIHGQFRNQSQFLINNCKSRILAVFDCLIMLLLSVNKNLSSIRAIRMNAG